MSLESDIKLLQNNMKDLQSQLGNAHKRIAELINDRDSALEDLKKEKETYAILSDRLNKTDLETQGKIQEKMDKIPDVLDSKPKTYKRPPQPGYSVKEGEKWVSIKDGKMEFEDIEIKD